MTPLFRCRSRQVREEICSTHREGSYNTCCKNRRKRGGTVKRPGSTSSAFVLRRNSPQSFHNSKNVGQLFEEEDEIKDQRRRSTAHGTLKDYLIRGKGALTISAQLGST